MVIKNILFVFHSSEITQDFASPRHEFTNFTPSVNLLVQNSEPSYPSRVRYGFEITLIQSQASSVFTSRKQKLPVRVVFVIHPNIIRMNGEDDPHVELVGEQH